MMKLGSFITNSFYRIMCKLKLHNYLKSMLVDEVNNKNFVFNGIIKRQCIHCGRVTYKLSNINALYRN